MCVNAGANLSAAVDSIRLAQTLRCVQEDFRLSIARGDVDWRVAQSVEGLFKEAADAACRGGIEREVLNNVGRFAAEVSIVGRGVQGLERGLDHILHEVVDQTRVKCASGCAFQLDDANSFLPYRRWYLAHFDHPYPDADDKAELLALVPSHNKQRLDTWFTNTRRRSGWQELKRRYTNGTAEGLRRLLDDAANPHSNVSDECREKIEHVKAFFSDAGRNQVSESIQELVKQGPPKTSTKRVVEPRPARGAVRGVGGGVEGASGGGGHARRRSTTPPTQSKFSSDFFATSPDSLSSSPLPSFPRYPSTFASPTNSTRSASNSSTSSFASIDSVLSYDSISTSPSFESPRKMPSSPPASSSLLNFDAPTPSSSASAHLARPLFEPRLQPVSIDNPYFFTLNDTPLLPMSPANPVLASSSLASFASNGDLIV